MMGWELELNKHEGFEPGTRRLWGSLNPDLNFVAQVNLSFQEEKPERTGIPLLTHTCSVSYCLLGVGHFTHEAGELF